MPVFAVSLLSTQGRGRDAATHILSARDWLQMGRVHAMAHPTEMVEFETIGDWTSKQFIREPMGHDGPRLGDLQPAVPIAMFGVAGPEPTPTGALLIDLPPKSLLGCSVRIGASNFRSPRSAPSRVMRPAETSRYDYPGALSDRASALPRTIWKYFGAVGESPCFVVMTAQEPRLHRPIAAGDGARDVGHGS